MVIEQLLAVQELDREIRSIRREVDAKASLRAQIAGQLDPAKRRVADAQSRLEALQLDIQAREAEAEDARLKIAKRKNDQLALKSNEAYRAMEKEIAELHERIRRAEDAAMESMVLRERAERMLQLEQEALAQETASVDESLAEFEARSAEREGRLEGLLKRRAEQAVGIPATVLTRYNRLFARHGDAAIARIEHGTCGSCHMKLSPAQIVAARKADAIATCDFCGRMLVAGE